MSRGKGDGKRPFFDKNIPKSHFRDKKNGAFLARAGENTLLCTLKTSTV